VGGGAFPPGCYRLELDLDSLQPTSGNLPASQFQVQFYLADVNESVTSLRLLCPMHSWGWAYSQTLSPIGGVAPLKWTVVPNPDSLPSGLALDPDSGKISGTTSAVGTYHFKVQVHRFHWGYRDASIYTEGSGTCGAGEPAGRPRERGAGPQSGFTADC